MGPTGHFTCPPSSLGQGLLTYLPMSDQLRLPLQRTEPFDPKGFMPNIGQEQAFDVLVHPDGWIDGRLALVGPQGSGKSHLLHVFCDRFFAHYIRADRLELADVENLMGQSLALDDADHADPELLFHLFNAIPREGGKLLLSFSKRPASLETPLADLKSRLCALRVVELALPDDQIMRALLSRLFAERAIRPTPETLDYLVSRIGRSPQDARAVVAEIDERSGDRAITRALARQILENYPVDTFDDE